MPTQRATSPVLTELMARADGGDLEAQKSLALLYDQGLDPVVVDPRDAYKYWLQAAKAGDGWAQVSTARCLIEGFGTARDMLQARIWLDRAADQGINSGKLREQILKNPIAATVLIVDDSDIVRFSLKDMVEGAGYKALMAVNGKEGLDRIRSHQVDFILSDVNMPVMDGITMVEQMAHLGLLGQRPVIMLTTESDKELVVRGKKAGVKGWLIKPPDRDKLLHVIGHLLQKK